MTFAGAIDRALTVVVTATTLTSAGWIVFGGSLVGDAHAPAKPAARAPVAVAEPVADIALQVPVQGVGAAELRDSFADRRDAGSRPHEAIDIPAPAGTPVLAAAAGTVEKLFLSKAGGLTIYVRSPDRRLIAYYAHLEAYAPGLAAGQQVARGQQIGTVGSSGNADSAVPHLHFAIMQADPAAGWWQRGKPINPYPLLVR